MLQLAGFWVALATFLGIWFGHVGVRWLEARSPSIWPPIVVLSAVGLALNVASFFVGSIALAGALSIIGFTLLWDAFEMYRQQNRVLKGHAPANPNNPRHAAILAAGKGTTEDLLDREPQGFQVVQETAQPPQSVANTASRKHELALEEVEV